MHEFWQETFRGYFVLPPMKFPPQEVLDIGCGSGAWAVDFADEFSNCQVYGVDISPVQPMWVPTNCTFYCANVLQGLSFHEDKFDLIQSRMMAAGIPDVQWPRYLGEMYRLTKQGGWIQLIEIDPLRYCDDGTMPCDSPLSTCERVCERVMDDRYGITIHDCAQNMAYLAQTAGFINIDMVTIRVPLGNWVQNGLILSIASSF
jgi:ubiquinone/menaquinone biosynthesis C-methylase UbiE